MVAISSVQFIYQIKLLDPDLSIKHSRPRPSRSEAMMPRWLIGDGVQLVAGRVASPFRRDDLWSQVGKVVSLSRRTQPLSPHMAGGPLRDGDDARMSSAPIIPRRVHCAARAAFIPARLGFISSSDDSSSVPVYMY